MARTPTRHYINCAIFGLFALVFAGFLGVTAYHYFNGAENVDIKSFGPGVPAFFLFFMARKEWRSAKAVSNMKKRLARRQAEEMELETEV